MLWAIEFAAEAEHDFELVFDHLVGSYRELGEPLADALDRAAERVEAIRAGADRLAAAPGIGTAHDDLLPGLRHVTIDGAIYWFEVDAQRRRVRVLAVFFGGQDHVRHMLGRLLAR